MDSRFGSMSLIVFGNRRKRVQRAQKLCRSGFAMRSFAAVRFNFVFAALICLVLCFAGCRHAEEPSAALPLQKQIYVVIDDAGLSIDEIDRFLEIPVPMTIAVLPHQRDTELVCERLALDSKKETILHQPMEAYDLDRNPGDGAIYDLTRPRDVTRIMRRNLASVPGAVGVNNHMGSRVTENPELMRQVLSCCNKENLYFLDSKTAFNSQVSRVAAETHTRIEERHVFLDIEHDRESIRRMWGTAVAHARQYGYVIVIGHAWSAESAAAIRDSYETLLNAGYTFHRVSELYK